jgi:hypothetical protein
MINRTTLEPQSTKGSKDSAGKENNILGRFGVIEIRSPSFTTIGAGSGLLRGSLIVLSWACYESESWFTGMVSNGGITQGIHSHVLAAV